MTSRDFAFWLQGFFEMANPRTIGAAETEMIKRHLNLVFKHEIDPSMGDKKHQDELNSIHTSPETTVFCDEKFPETEEDAIICFGEKPGPNYKFDIHGWYNPEEGVLRC